MKKVIIVHPSPVICHGLTEVINSYFNAGVITFKTIAEFIAKAPDFNSLVVMMHPLEVNDMNQVRKLKQSQQITTICLNWPEIIHSKSFIYDYHISLWAPKGEYYDLLAPLMTSQETLQTEKNKNELTARETDVVRSIALGLTNKEMADKLHISIHTVISHRKNITAKLGIKSISGITVYAILSKLVDTETIDPETLI